MRKSINKLLAILYINISLFIGLSFMSAILYFGFCFANNNLSHNIYHSQLKQYSNVKKVSVHNITSKAVNNNTFLIKGKNNENKLISFYSSEKPKNNQVTTYYIAEETGLFSQTGYTSKQAYKKSFAKIKKTFLDNRRKNVQVALNNMIISMKFFAIIIIIFDLLMAFCKLCIKLKIFKLKSETL